MYQRFANSFGYAAIAVFLVSTSLAAEEGRVFPEATHGAGELFYVGKIPVLILSGGPEEMGEQQATLLARSLKPFIALPKTILDDKGVGMAWPLIVQIARQELKKLPTEHRKEFDAALHAGQLSQSEIDVLVVMNTMWEYMGTGCSSFIVEPARSVDGGMIFGRNLDFPDYGHLHEVGLVVVHQPREKHAFLSIGFPGVSVVFSGINDAGLCIAAHAAANEPKDGSLPLNPMGAPVYANVRRALEECATVSEAEAFLSTKTYMSRQLLVICDRETSEICELTTKGVYVRHCDDGLLACTNHYRCPEIAGSLDCWRYRKLENLWNVREPLSEQDTEAAMRSVSVRDTIQSMVFEPRTMRLHLHLSHPYRSDDPLYLLDVGNLFKHKVSE
jgi:hypothetical protein